MPESGNCLYKGMRVACGPPGLDGGRNILMHNNGDGTFSDVSEKSGIWKTAGTYGLGVLVSDFDNDGVAYSADGKPQAGMGVSAADFDCDGWLDIIKTNFAGDTSSLYHNTGDGFFEDTTFQAGLGRNTRFLGWGAMFLDFDNDGWVDI